MQLFLVHAGFYDKEVAGGLYEQHINLFVVAADFDDAKARAKALPEFKAKRMHVDGLLEVTAVDGFRIDLVRDPRLGGDTVTLSSRQRAQLRRAGKL